MARILVRKGKKEFIEELDREVQVVKEKNIFVTDTDNDFHTEDGVISKEDLHKPDGTIIESSHRKKFTILSPTFIDHYKRIERLAQVIPLKDIGLIIAETGIGKDSIVVDSGSGSGALSTLLAHVCKSVSTYDIREDHLEAVRRNIETLGLNNIKAGLGNFYEGVPDTDADLLTLDLPEPWLALDSAARTLKIGGFMVSYSPCITQVNDFADAVRKDERFLYLKTIEIIERPWDVDRRKVRPKTTGIGHSGFMTFARRIQ